MLIECKKCGAPLDVKGTERLARCAYCGTTTKLRETRTLSVETPQGWSPPPEWVPRNASPKERQKPLRYHRRRAPAGCSCAAVFPLLIVAAGVLVPLYLSGQLDGLPLVGKVDRWDGESTLECGLNQHLTLEDEQADVIDGPVIHATGPNCRVTIRRSRLRGSEVVRGDLNTEIVVEDSTLEAAYDAFTGSTNMKLRILGPATVVVAGGDAVRGGDNLELEVRGATLRGGRTAITADSNPKLEIWRARLEGGEHAVRLRQNAEVRITESEVVGETSFGRNAEVDRR